MRYGLWCGIPEKPHAACVWIMLSLFVVYVAERTCELVEVGEIFLACAEMKGHLHCPRSLNAL